MDTIEKPASQAGGTRGGECRRDVESPVDRGNRELNVSSTARLLCGTVPAGSLPGEWHVQQPGWLGLITTERDGYYGLITAERDGYYGLITAERDGDYG